MAKRTAFEASIEKRQAVRDAEAAGGVADSMDVRLALMARVKSGEISLSQAQAELMAIKRNAKKSGKATRAQVFNRS